jgi:hypothetical protein
LTVSAGPVFLAGTDRSGIGLLGEILTAHPRIFISRRTRFWNFYYQRFGDLRERSNLAAVIDEMMRYTRIMDLSPDRERLLAEFDAGAAGSGYGQLFALIQRHHLERIGKARWGDKTLNAERYAWAIFNEYPTARMIHVIRDPRDRFASQANHRTASRGKVGAGTALWLSSIRRGMQNVAAYPGRYEIVRYEDLVSQPRAIVERVCRFIDEPFEMRMLQATPVREDDASIPGVGTQGLVTSSVGRFRSDLSDSDIAFIQLVAGRAMRAMHYEPVEVPMSSAERIRFGVADVPLNLMRMGAWWINMNRRERTAGAPSDRRVAAGD